MIEMQFYRQRLTRLFLVSKMVLFLVAFICALFIEPYNRSIGMILFPKDEPPLSRIDFWIKRLLRPFASWDGAYFMTIALKGYVYEQEHAFLPLYPSTMRLIASVLMRPLAPIVSITGRCLLSGVLISNICHYISVTRLYNMSCLIFGDSYFAFLSAAFMILVPLQAVMSAVYSESLFGCLVIVGLHNFYQKKRAMAALAWCLAGCTRSNGIFLPGFFIYEYIHSVRHLPKFVLTRACLEHAHFRRELRFGL